MTYYVRVKPSVTCYAGYWDVHLLRKYTSMLGFLPLANSKIPLLRSAAALLLSDFLVVRSGETKCQLRCRLVSFLATKNAFRRFPSRRRINALPLLFHSGLTPETSASIDPFDTPPL